jgi:hypothetical protein
MTARTDPFVRVTCKCPVCEQEVVNRYIKSKMYTPVTTEDDHFVREYRWELEQYKRLRPEYYHVWYCAHCNFCEEKEVFRGEDDLGGKLEMLQDKLLIESRRPDSVMSRLGACIDFQGGVVSWSSALAAHLLAIFIQNQLSPNMRMNGKLARLYLRTAWLWRELRYPELHGGKDPLAPELKELLDGLREEWPDGPFEEETAMDKAIEYYKLDLEGSGRTENVRHEVSTMFLLVSLYKRLDDKRTAYSYLRMIFSECQKRRMSVKKALDGAAKRDNVSGRQMEHLRSLHQWLGNTVERTSGMLEELGDAIFREEYPRARETVLAMSNPEPDAVRQKLQDEGFFGLTCQRVSQVFKKDLIETDVEDLDEAEAAHDRAAREERNRGLLGRLAKMFKGDDREG